MKQILVNGHPAIQGAKIEFTIEPFIDLSVGTRFWKIGYNRNSSCRAFELKKDPMTYSGTVIVEGQKYWAFKVNATNFDKKYLFPVDETIYLLFVLSDYDSEVWLQDFKTLNLIMMKPLFEIEIKGVRTAVDYRSEYWKKRHDKEKKS